MTYQRPLRQNQLSFRRLVAFVLVASWCSSLSVRGQSQPRVIEVLADRDSRYKIAGQKQPVIAVKAGEPITLRITANKAKNRNRDGSIHGFTLLRAKDRQPVDGWDLLLKPGTQDFTLIAPSEAGEYVAICTVICSQDHEQMNMKFLVEP
jgi:heme/copper-type cytochrome/quinol oxidase subunit 2